MDAATKFIGRAIGRRVVIFLAGGSRVLPMVSISQGVTLEQADALVAQLREG